MFCCVINNTKLKRMKVMRCTPAVFCLCLSLLAVSACQGEARNETLDDSPYHAFDEHEHQKGEGYGFLNQQRYRNNPIARMVTRDDRPSRGMNGYADGSPLEMRSQEHTHPYLRKSFTDVPERYKQPEDRRELQGSLQTKVTHLIKETDPYAGIVIVETDTDLFIGLRSGKGQKDLTLMETSIKNQADKQTVHFIYSDKGQEKLAHIKNQMEKGRPEAMLLNELEALK